MSKIEKLNLGQVNAYENDELLDAIIDIGAKLNEVIDALNSLQQENGAKE